MEGRLGEPQALPGGLHIPPRRSRRERISSRSKARTASFNETPYNWPGNVREVARACSLFVIHAQPGIWIDCALIERSYPTS